MSFIPTTTRTLGTKFFSANYEVKKAGPLDARLITPLKSELYDVNSIEFRYPGMIITVIDDGANNGVYFNSNPSTGSDTGLQESDWIKLGDGQGTGGGNPVAKVEYDLSTENLIVTLTHDGNGNEADWQADGAAIDIAAATAKTKSTGQITLEGVDLVSSFDQKYIEYNEGGDYTLVTATLDGSDTVLTFLGNATFETTDTEIQTYVNNGADPIVHITNIPAGGVYSPLEYGMDSSTAVVPVGGFEASDTAGTLNGTPFTEMWNTLLFPAIPPTPGSVGYSLNLNNPSQQNSILVIGDVINLDLLAAVNNSYNPNWSSGEVYTPGVEKAIYDQKNTSTGDWDQLAELENTGASNNIPDYTGTTYTVQATTVGSVTSNANPNLWRSTVHFLPGTEVGSDNLGNDSGNPFAGSSIEKQVGVFGTLPIYMNDESDNWEQIAGKASVGVNSGPKLQKISDTTVEWYARFSENAPGTTYPRHKIAVPQLILENHGDNGITKFMFFDTNKDKFEDFASQEWNLDGTETFTINGVAYTYDVYHHNGSTQAAGDLEYKLFL